jgi:hypothetical protein
MRREERVFWFSLKTGGDGFTSKSLLWFGDLGLKITMTVSWFGPKNQGEEVCQFTAQN